MGYETCHPERERGIWGSGGARGTCNGHRPPRSLATLGMTRRFLFAIMRCQIRGENSSNIIAVWDWTCSIKLSVSGITNWVDGEEVDLYIRSSLPDAGREAA